MLVDQFMTGRHSYCKLNHNTPILRLWSDEEAELKHEFRISRRAMNSLKRLLQREQDHGWGNHLEILIYTYWLAHGLSYRMVSSVFNVPKATVHRIVHRVVQNICLNLKRAISFPQKEELPAVGQGFVQLSGTTAFHSVVGVIGCTHILPQQHQKDYLGCHSINMQAICDSNGRFLDIFVAYPGSVHEAEVMKNSTLYKTRCYPPRGYVLFGHGSYPCLETPVCLITPYKEPVDGQVQERFNYHHSRGHSIIERAFGMVKTRWSTLFSALEVKPTFAPKVIASCAFLHNVCLDNGDTLEPDDNISEDNLDPQPPCDGMAYNETSGNATRDRLAALVLDSVEAS
ncbi:putative nuclease HARBI1 [Thalassophryne amazonica]|uniref:putative nuclease HARBI1 n=1 Tax=Thalassophryne amazonica TaxID=390379 RepID=UPI001472418F|nr:putative nuclease HARBI1 [Thalassophryne amazonica]